MYHSVMNGQVEAGANLRAYLLGGFEFAVLPYKLGRCGLLLRRMCKYFMRRAFCRLVG